MARIAGVDLPKNKKISIALTYIFGIGKAQSVNILNAIKIDLNGGGTGLTLEANQLGQACTRVGISKIWYTTTGMGVKILWKATSDALAIELNTDWSDELCFENFTALTNSEASGATGDVAFTTVGAGSGDTYTIIIKFTKYYG